MLYFDSHLLQGETSPLFKAGGMVLTFGQRKTCHIVKKFGSFFSENGHGWANNSWYLNLGLGGVCEGCCGVGCSIVKTAGKVVESKPTKSDREPRHCGLGAQRKGRCLENAWPSRLHFCCEELSLSSRFTQECQWSQKAELGHFPLGLFAATASALCLAYLTSSEWIVAQTTVAVATWQHIPSDVHVAFCHKEAQHMDLLRNMHQVYFLTSKWINFSDSVGSERK